MAKRKPNFRVNSASALMLSRACHLSAQLATFIYLHRLNIDRHAQAIETLLDNGKRNPAAGLMLALLAEMTRNEAETLRERIQSGLEEARRKGRLPLLRVVRWG